MKKVNYIAILAAIIFGFSMTAQAAVTNDNFSSAMPLVLSEGSIGVTTNNVGATKETGEPNHAENPGGKSVWFKFTPTATTVIRINTTDNTVDTLLGVYTGNSVNNLTLIGYNDDCNTACGQASSVDLMMTAGTTYYIVVDGLNDNGNIGEGNFKITLYDSVMPLTDGFQGAMNLGFSVRGSIAGTNYNAAAEPNEPSPYGDLNPDGKSVWYKWTPSASLSMAFELTENFDSQIGIYTSNVGNPTVTQLNKVAYNIDGIHFTDSQYRTTFFAQSGKTYYIQVANHHLGGSATQAGNFQLKFYPNQFRYSAKLSSFHQKSSISVFRPSSGVWYSSYHLNETSPEYRTFGVNGDAPLIADFNGDGSGERAVVRNENGKKVWYIDTGGVSLIAMSWGLSTDRISIGDFDADGRADLVAIRNMGANLVWYVRQSSNGALRAFTFGIAGDKPVAGDFDGDGMTDVAVIRSTQNGLFWHILKSNGSNYNQYASLQFGTAPDDSAIEDFDGDGKTDIAVFRPSNGTWYILQSSNGQVRIDNFGLNGDKPQAADYNGDGKADLAVFRPSNGTWYIAKPNGAPAQNFHAIQWGMATDIPVSSISSVSN